MEILIFILVIVALIVVHELGHFVAAKLSGMRVDEFGLGYPPRAVRLAKVGETEYTLNWLPFGGFVKIYGEDGEFQGSGVGGQVSGNSRSFAMRPRILQAFVLVAGIAMNLVFAYLLITAALVAGTPRALSPAEIAHAKSVELAVAQVLPDTPAARAGLAPGDAILHAEDGHYAYDGADPAAFSDFVAQGGGNATLALSVEHANGKEETVFARPALGIVPGEPARAALGVEIAPVGVVPVPFWSAFGEGASLTWGATVVTAEGLAKFFVGVFMLHADLSQVAGPVGIAGAVGGAAATGLGDLLSLMAIISINLALINLIPVPALDGGRLLFVAIEAVIRRPIKPSVAQGVNAVGFALLVLLMVVVTFHDIYRIAG